MASFVRISALLWANILAGYALWLMVNYLTNVWKLNFTHAAAIVNIYTGAATIMPIGMAFLVDTFMGDYVMLSLSSLAYCFGLIFLAMSTPPVLSHTAGNCSAYKPDCIGHTQKVMFYTALALIAVGLSGHSTSLQSFLDFQEKEGKDKDDPHTKKQDDTQTKKPMQIVGAFFVVLVAIIGCIALPYIKPWQVRFWIPAIFTIIATVLFFSGSREYKHEKPKGSPLTAPFRVSLAYAWKVFNWLQREANDQEQPKRLEHCTTKDVRDTKVIIRMITMCLAFVMCGIVISIGNTYFLEQANHMNRKLGHIKVPLPIFLIFYDISKELCRCIFIKFVRDSKDENPKDSKDENSKDKNSKYTPPIGFVVAMVFSGLCCITAAKVEARRLDVIKSHGLLDKPDDKIPMTVFWLLPQFLLLGALDGISDHSLTCLFKRRGPLSKGRYPHVFTGSIRGAGVMWSVLSVYVVRKVSGRGGKSSWFQDSLNKSRLDNYYWTLTVFSSINLVLFIPCAIWYACKESAQPEPVNGNEAQPVAENGPEE